MAVLPRQPKLLDKGRALIKSKQIRLAPKVPWCHHNVNSQGYDIKNTNFVGLVNAHVLSKNLAQNQKTYACV